MYCQGLSLRTTGQAGIWPGETVIPLLLWCVVFVLGLVRVIRPCVMTKQLLHSYPLMCSSTAMPVYSPQQPDLTITMQIHLSVLPDTWMRISPVCMVLQAITFWKS